MENIDLRVVGRILKSHGNNGQLLIRLNPGIVWSGTVPGFFYVSVYGENVPYFYNSFHLTTETTALLAFEDIGSVEDAEKFTGSELLMPSSLIRWKRTGAYSGDELVGFKVYDEVAGYIGVVEAMLEMPLQAVLKIQAGEKEILVPFVEEIVLKTDRRRKQIHIQAPDGLIALYLK